jgi:pterin-4a-carbinolamine dehydratase
VSRRPSALRDEALRDAVSRLGEAWSLDTREGSEVLRATFRFAAPRAAEDFVVGAFEVVDAIDHHPVIEIAYTTVTVSTSTHEPLGITQLDLDLAAAFSDLAERHGVLGS